MLNNKSAFAEGKTSFGSFFLLKPKKQLFDSPLKTKKHRFQPLNASFGSHTNTSNFLSFSKIRYTRYLSGSKDGYYTVALTKYEELLSKMLVLLKENRQLKHENYYLLKAQQMTKKDENMLNQTYYIGKQLEKELQKISLRYTVKKDESFEVFKMKMYVLSKQCKVYYYLINHLENKSRKLQQYNREQKEQIYQLKGELEGEELLQEKMNYISKLYEELVIKMNYSHMDWLAWKRKVVLEKSRNYSPLKEEKQRECPPARKTVNSNYLVALDLMNYRYRC